MGWHHPAGAGEDGPLPASSASEGIRPGEGNFLLFCKGAFCRQSFVGLALTSQDLPWVAEGSGMVVSWTEAGLLQRQRMRVAAAGIVPSVWNMIPLEVMSSCQGREGEPS